MLGRNKNKPNQTKRSSERRSAEKERPRNEILSSRDERFEHILGLYDGACEQEVSDYDDVLRSLDDRPIQNHNEAVSVEELFCHWINGHLACTRTILRAVHADIERQFNDVSFSAISEMYGETITNLEEIISTFKQSIRGSSYSREQYDAKFRLEELLGQVPSDIQDSVQALLDVERFNYMMEQQSKSSNSMMRDSVRDMPATFSTPQAVLAADAALDKVRFEDYLERKKLLTTHYMVDPQVDTPASTDAASAMMHGALDGYRYDLMRRDALYLGRKSDFYSVSGSAQTTADRLTSNVELLVEPQAQRVRSDERFDGSPKGGDRRSEGVNSQRQQHYEQPKAPDTATQKVAAIKQKLADEEYQKEHPGFQWIQDESDANILRVMNTVEAIREKAAANGKEMTDQKIYSKYRRKAELVHDDRGAKIHESVHILTAMMGGDVHNGKLPF